MYICMRHLLFSLRWVAPAPTLDSWWAREYTCHGNEPDEHRIYSVNFMWNRFHWLEFTKKSEPRHLMNHYTSGNGFNLHLTHPQAPAVYPPKPWPVDAGAGCLSVPQGYLWWSLIPSTLPVYRKKTWWNMQRYVPTHFSAKGMTILWTRPSWAPNPWPWCMKPWCPNNSTRISK